MMVILDFYNSIVIKNVFYKVMAITEKSSLCKLQQNLNYLFRYILRTNGNKELDSMCFSKKNPLALPYLSILY